MRRTHMSLLIVYLIFTAYFAIFNWSMFVVQLNVSMGFVVLNLPVMIIIFLLGLIFMLIQWGIESLGKMKMEKDFALKNNEVIQLKAAQYDTNLTEINQNLMTLKKLDQKLSKIISKLEIVEDEKIPA